MGSQVRILSIDSHGNIASHGSHPGGGCPGSTTGSAGRRNQHIRDHWQEGRRALANAGIQAPSGVQARTFTRKPAIPLSAGGLYVTAVRRIRKSTAMRMWCSGSTPASQAGNRGSNPVIRSIRKTKTMDLINNGTRNRPFHVDASGENMDEQPRHGHASSRTGTCHRPGSSEEEQVPFKHWVRIS